MAKFQEYEWDFEYEVFCYDENGVEICNYGIEADCPEDAEACAREFCADDYPDIPVAKVHVELIDKEYLAELAELAEYERVARVNPYCI